MTERKPVQNVVGVARKTFSLDAEFTGQTIERIEALAGMIQQRGCKTLIEVDGGVNAKTVAAIARALGQLPISLRGPLLESAQGHPLRAIAEDHGYSESTAHRRIAEARDQLRAELAVRPDEGNWVPFIRSTDPVLERAQRLYEQGFPPSSSVDPGRGPAR